MGSPVAFAVSCPQLHDAVRWVTAQCPVLESSGLGFMANYFDVVLIGANDESRVVVRVVARAQTRRAIVLATRRQRRSIERVDLRTSIGNERQMKMCWLLVSLE